MKLRLTEQVLMMKAFIPVIKDDFAPEVPKKMFFKNEI